MSLNYDKQIEKSMQAMEEFRVSEFLDKPVVYAKDKYNGRLLVYSKGEHADKIIEFIESLK